MLNIPKMINPLTPNLFQTPPHHFNQTNIQCSSNHSSVQQVVQPQSQEAKFFQYSYPTPLYQSELDIHNQSLSEYEDEIYQVMTELLESNKPNLELYKQQPYLTFSIRLKLIDFLLKMSIRLKILPFVFYKAVKIFDRYCSKRIVLLDQSQLIITTCLWIASKVQGGNNHFVNLTNLEKLSSIKTINDLGYGSGGKYLGPTERFRLPKLHELVKLCGAKCKYDQGMFKQMELHVLTTLDWSLNDPSIEEFIVYSDEFSIIDDGLNSSGMSGLNVNEMFKIKEFLSYISLYSFELIDTNLVDLSKVMIDLINETFGLTVGDPNYQELLPIPNASNLDINTYKHIKKNLIKSILNASDFILKLFNSKGSQYLYQQIHMNYKNPLIANTPSPFASCHITNSIILNTPKKSFNSNQSYQTPPCTRTIPPAHQLSSTYKIFNSSNIASSQIPSSVPPNPPQTSVPSIMKNYKTISYSNTPNEGYTCSRSIYKLPSINTTCNHTGSHQHNNSSASLNSSASSKGESHDGNGVGISDIFELDYSRKGGISTPVSENDSPIYSMVKP